MASRIIQPSLRLEAHLSKWHIPLLIRSRSLRIRLGYCENADEHVRKLSPPSDEDDSHQSLGH
jgi:hypothetical protein